MISINTNLSSFIAQNSLKTSTNKLNETVERMSTGYKINHAKDNAANYSISTNMTTKLGAYQVAEDNTAMGLDMVTTASENLSLIEDKLTRLRSLVTQAQNGTYGTQSLNAMQEEANAITQEIQRIYETAKYNGVSLLNNYEAQPPESLSYLKAKSEYNNFINNPYDYTEQEVANMDKLSSISDTTTISGGQYSISTHQELAQLAKMTNDGYITGGEFVLAKDIDLSSYDNWTPIGNSTNPFQATFNGNGHVIKNLKITSSTSSTGLFGHISSSTVKNVGLIDCNVNVSSKWVGGLVGYSKDSPSLSDSTVLNVYVTGKIKGYYYVGSIVGYNEGGGIENSYSNASIDGDIQVGGISGYYQGNPLKECFFDGSIKGSTSIGGLVGGLTGKILNCYSKAQIKGNSKVGGIVGLQYAASRNGALENCHAFGSVEAIDQKSLGELIGTVAITNDGSNFGTFIINECSTLSAENQLIGSVINLSTNYIYDDYDKTAWLEEISQASLNGINTILQVGISSSKNSNISIDTNLKYKSLNVLKSFDISNIESIKTVDDLLSQVSDKQTQLGSVSNRLESVLDEIATQYDNLVSSRSTLRDADMAELSSTYIQQQILQEASATLMATANQMPAIALQLL